LLMVSLPFPDTRHGVLEYEYPSLQSIIKERNTQEQASNSQNHVANETRPTDCATCSKAESEAQSSQPDPYDPMKDRLYRWYLRATIIGVAGGFIVISLLLWQSILLRRSTKAAEDAAKLANQSTKSLKSSERAHLDIDFVPIRLGASRHHFNVTNYGRSPANVVMYTFARYQPPPTLKQLPETIEGLSNWSKESRTVNQMLPIGPVVTALEFDISHSLSQEQRSGEQMAIYSGSVTYLDIFGDEHKTEVVYSYEPSTSSLINQPRFNKYT
jgi:hypothetical protein